MSGGGRDPSAAYRAALEVFDGLLARSGEVWRTSTRIDEKERRSALAFVEESRELAHAPPYRLAGLQQLQRDLLCQWEEAAGEDVERFWAAIAQVGPDVPRKHDLVVEALARGRILRMEHFVALDDAFEELQECGKIDAAQTEQLSRLLDAFENDPANRSMFL